MKRREEQKNRSKLWLAKGIAKSTDDVELDGIVAFSFELYQMNMSDESYLMTYILF